MSEQTERAYLQDWAARQKCVFEDEGEVGFGRECVGIVGGSCFVDLCPKVVDDVAGAPFRWTTTLPEAEPPEGVEDAYDKHPCLAVLGRGPGAIHQLYLWVKSIEANGLRVVREGRHPDNAVDAIFHGLTRYYLSGANL